MANVAEDRKSKLNEAMSRASKLIKLEANGTIDKIAKGHRENIDTSLGGDANINIKEMMTVNTKKAPLGGNVVVGNTSRMNTNVPLEIRESFKRQTINENELYGAMGANNELSFLTEGLDNQLQVGQTEDQVKQYVREGLIERQPQMQVSSQQVDYPMIRTIVEDIVRKYTSSLKNKILSESKQQNVNELNTLTIGKTFKFLDSKGNIYEAQLKKIGNINEKRVTN